MPTSASAPVVASAVSAIIPSSVRRLIENVVSSVEMPITVQYLGLEIAASRPSASKPGMLIRIKHPGVIRRLVQNPDPIVILESYLNGWLEFTGGIDEFISFGHQMCIQSARMSPWSMLQAYLESMSMPALELQLQQRDWELFPAGSRARDKAAVHYHYDVGNEFYKLWLDPEMIYSCAYYTGKDCSLEEAQQAKLDIICRKLMLKPGERLLDIGCGWSGLIRYAAKYYGVTAHGITLSEAQLDYCRKKIAEDGLSERVSVELLHYADLSPSAQFDKIASIEMIEQVGIKNYATYFSNINRCLKPEGLFLCQAITSIKDRSQKDLAERFIGEYIFPDGELATLPKTLDLAKSCGWETVDVESWRPHYARTLREWAAKLDRSAKDCDRLAGERRTRLWQLYLVGCALAYEGNRLGLYQLLLRKSDDHRWNLPWHRQGWLA